MHIQVSGQHSEIGESMRSAAESLQAAMAAGGIRRMGLRAGRGPRGGGRARKRLGRHGRYLTWSGGFFEAAGPEIGTRATRACRDAAHGGLEFVRRPNGNIGWIDAGLERLARG